MQGYLGSGTAERIHIGGDHSLDTEGHAHVQGLTRRSGAGRAFETARTAVYGGTAATGIATAAIALGTLVFPGLGTIIAAAGASVLTTLGASAWIAGAKLSLREPGRERGHQRPKGGEG
ncbi:MAG: hypothetical protein R3F31_03415 [Verrucomicrobiales bacterium]